MNNSDLYTTPIMLTSQFVMCGNCFRCDTYRGCSYGCKYCFAQSRFSGFHLERGNEYKKNQVADLKLIERLFCQAITENRTDGIIRELLNRFTPLHLGGMADPFPTKEFQLGITRQFIEISSKYNYPINISTKVAHLPDKYWKILDPKIHTFQISLIGTDLNYIRNFETNTPNPDDRINFIKELHERGFWVSVRIQPLIEFKEAIKVIEKTQNYCNYFTVEHLKIPVDHVEKKLEIISILKKIGFKTQLKVEGREWEFNTQFKLNNILKIKKITKIPIGCGDNDLHLYSDSLNCCGVDLMPKSFSNWWKCNSMYIKMTGKNPWCPKNDVSYALLSGRVKNFTARDYTDRYYNKTYKEEKLKLF